MVYDREAQLDLIFQALSDKTRRHMLSRLGRNNLGISELASTYKMTLPAVSKHVRVLERAGLVSTTKEGRIFRCALRFEPFEIAARQIDFYKKFWNSQLDGLESYVRNV